MINVNMNIDFIHATTYDQRTGC